MTVGGCLCQGPGTRYNRVTMPHDKVSEIKQDPWPQGWREETFEQLNVDWDLIVIGGGITGVGIFSLAARMGLRALLLERGDFGSGTSSRSSKLIHGGLRYLKDLRLRLTWESVHDREHLLSVSSGLVQSLPFVYPVYSNDKLSPWMVALGLRLYTCMAGKGGGYHRLSVEECISSFPGMARKGLISAFQYNDATTDDARLVLRVLRDALSMANGRAKSLNYCPVLGMLSGNGRVTGVACQDSETGRTFEIRSRLVVNAAGVWAAGLQSGSGNPLKIRPLRGSHLYFSWAKLPVDRALGFPHPDDRRPVFLYPWAGVTLVGTTDVDHRDSLTKEPQISHAEADYLLRAVQVMFPEAGLRREDVLSTQAGLRPVIDTGKTDPSAESRDYALLGEPGLLTVSGGKLTTFRSMAMAALKAAHSLVPEIPDPTSKVPEVFLPPYLPVRNYSLTESDSRLLARYGTLPEELKFDAAAERITGTDYSLAEIEWSIKKEAVVHLEDLLLRRFRCGILSFDGGLSALPKLEPVLRKSLDWSDARWKREVSDYASVLATTCRLPAAG